jgi:Domain of unknown function (DUF4394)/Calx-beta domain
MSPAALFPSGHRAGVRCLLAFLLISSLSAVDAIYAVTSTNRLVRFRSDTPGTVVQVTAAITGLQASETILGIDLRPATGELLALGSTGRLYTLNASTGAATAIGILPAFSPTGVIHGVDVNPTVDRVRVIADNGTNMRLDPITGGIVATDLALNPDSPSAVACAYSNNVVGATVTTLYVIDSATDELMIQNPPNNGTLVSVGSLGIAIDANASFDISGITGMAYTIMQTSGTPNLYTINLTTGAATLVGAVNVTGPVTGMSVGPAPGSIRFAYANYSAAENAGNAVITLLREAGSQGTVGATLNTALGSATVGADLTAITTAVSFANGETSKTVLIPILDDALIEDLETVPLTLSTPTGGADLAGSLTNVLSIVDNELLPATLVALTASNTLIQFNAAVPGTVTATTTVTGLQAAENLLGIDYRPANGQLLALGSTSRLYSINLTTGAATVIGVPFSTPALSGTNFGFDVNPTVDRVRVVSDIGQNLRLDPDTGAVTAADINVAFAAGDVNQAVTPAVMASAYTNNLAGATSTMLYALDSGVDALVSQIPPNNGTLNTIGGLSVAANATSGFDIRTVGTTNSAFAALRVGSSSNLYAIDLTTGKANLIGTIGNGSDLRGLAVVSGAGSAPPAGSGHTPSPSPSVSSGGGGGGCGVGGSAATFALMLFAFMTFAFRRR